MDGMQLNKYLHLYSHIFLSFFSQIQDRQIPSSSIKSKKKTGKQYLEFRFQESFSRPLPSPPPFYMNPNPVNLDSFLP